jgi:hypothetical protein
MIQIQELEMDVAILVQWKEDGHVLVHLQLALLFLMTGFAEVMKLAVQQLDCQVVTL